MRSTSGSAIASSLLYLVLNASLAAAAPGTLWLDFTAASLQAGTAMSLSTSAGTLVDVTVQTGGTQGLYSFNRDTLGALATGLDYDSLYCLAIFNGGGTGSVPTTITFSNIRACPGHERGVFLVGAVAGTSSPVTISSSIAGRVPNWTQVGNSFPFSPAESFVIDWVAASGQFHTNALAGNDSRGIVIDLGDLRADGVITVSLAQHLNDGIYFALGEKLLAPLPVSPSGAETAPRLVPPRPNPARDAADFEFVLPTEGHARLTVFDVVGRRLATLRDGQFAAGRHSVRWDLRDSRGARVSDGLVFVRLETAAGVRDSRMIVLR